MQRMQGMLLLSILSLSAIAKATKIPLKKNYASMRSEGQSTKYTATAAANIYAEGVQSRFDSPLVRSLVDKSSFNSVIEAFFQPIKDGDDRITITSFETRDRSTTTIGSVPLPSPCLEGLIQNHLPTIDIIKAYRNEVIKTELRSGRVQGYVDKRGQAVPWAVALKSVFTLATDAAARFASSPDMYARAFNSVVVKFYKNMKMQAISLKMDPHDKSFRQPSFTLCKKDALMVASYNDHAAAPGFLSPPELMLRFKMDNGAILAYVPAKSLLYVAYFEDINMGVLKCIADISPSIANFKLENHPAFFKAFFREAARP